MTSSNMMISQLPRGVNRLPPRLGRCSKPSMVKRLEITLQIDS